MFDWLWNHVALVMFISFMIGFVGAIAHDLVGFILEQTHARFYRTLRGHESWGIRRRPSGCVEVSLGRWVITTEPG